MVRNMIKRKRRGRFEDTKLLVTAALAPILDENYSQIGKAVANREHAIQRAEKLEKQRDQARRDRAELADKNTQLATDLEKVSAKLVEYERLVQRYTVKVSAPKSHLLDMPHELGSGTRLELEHLGGGVLQTLSFPEGLTGDLLRKAIDRLDGFAEEHAALAGAKAFIVEVK